MPVDQSGENILFVSDGTTVEAHVQVQYTGEAARFAWVIPMPTIPQIEIGSQALFDNLLSSTTPQYGFSIQNLCALGGSSGAAGSFGSAGAGGSAGGPGADAGPPPTVVRREVVGSFDIVVLQGGTAQTVDDWLVVNSYQTSAGAPLILQKYLDAGSLFVAIKLTGDATLDEIHPLTFRYSASSPTIPLGLTAVASTPNMAVRVFFLGDDRFFPSNYRHITLNPARVDWMSFGQNYTQALTRAVDELQADGQAFVTEYAGTSSIVPTGGLFSTTWDDVPFVAAQAEDVVDTLTAQGLASCSSTRCQYNHPMILGLLREYLPVPSIGEDGGAPPDEDSYYACLTCFSGLIDRATWDGAAFAADLRSRVIDPGQRARDLLLTSPSLTRLFTTISPAEMFIDPSFHPRSGLGNVDFTSQAGTLTTVECGTPPFMTLPGGRDVELENGNWPAFSSSMPFAERIENVPAAGPVQVLVDNRALIDEELRKWNELQRPGRGAGGAPGVGGAPGASGGAPGTGTGGTGVALDDGGTAAGNMGGDTASGAGGAGVSFVGSDGGCTVGRGASRPSTLTILFALAAALGFRSRRRSARSKR